MKPTITIDHVGTMRDSSTAVGKSREAEQQERYLWSKIISAAKQDTRLQEAVDRVKILYYMTLDNESK